MAVITWQNVPGANLGSSVQSVGEAGRALGAAFKGLGDDVQNYSNQRQEADTAAFLSDLQNAPPEARAAMVQQAKQAGDFINMQDVNDRQRQLVGDDRTAAAAARQQEQYDYGVSQRGAREDTAAAQLQAALLNNQRTAQQNQEYVDGADARKMGRQANVLAAEERVGTLTFGKDMRAGNSVPSTTVQSLMNSALGLAPGAKTPLSIPPSAVLTVRQNLTKDYRQRYPTASVAAVNAQINKDLVNAGYGVAVTEGSNAAALQAALNTKERQATIDRQSERLSRIAAVGDGNLLTAAVDHLMSRTPDQSLVDKAELQKSFDSVIQRMSGDKPEGTSADNWRLALDTLFKRVTVDQDFDSYNDYVLANVDPETDIRKLNDEVLRDELVRIVNQITAKTAPKT